MLPPLPPTTVPPGAVAVDLKQARIAPPDECPVCGLEGYVRKSIFHCDGEGDDHHTIDLTPDSGLDAVIRATEHVMPSSIRNVSDFPSLLFVLCLPPLAAGELPILQTHQRIIMSASLALSTTKRW